MPVGFYSLLFSQFFSSLADNALLILLISILQSRGEEAYWIPVVKLLFTVAFVFTGPWAGVISDTWSKNKVMFASNALRCLACFAILLGMNPIVCFMAAGLGAAVFSPAKYGWVMESSHPHSFMKANGWLEIFTITGILLGVVLGGLLTGLNWHRIGIEWLTDRLDASLGHETISILVVAMVYLVSLLITLDIPSPKVQTISRKWAFVETWNRFVDDQKMLWRDKEGFISLFVTTQFWGVTAVMQLLTLAWAQSTLHFNLSQATFLQAYAAIGVAIGSALAGKWIQLRHAPWVLGVGVAMGLLLPIMNWVADWTWAVGVTMTMGLMGGVFVVPMNALLQARGTALMTSGRSIAVQNSCENLNVLVSLGLYSLMIALEVELSWIIGSLALFMVLVNGWLIRHVSKSNSAPHDIRIRA